ncbi:MAG: phospholipase D family protein [Opitutae bacterium]|nr:phospholipase D family protein [Opitutae bacterium]
MAFNRVLVLGVFGGMLGKCARRICQRGLLAVAMSLLLFGCQTVNHSVPRRTSYGLEALENTRFGQIYAGAQQRNPGRSGFRLLEYGPEALMARAAIVEGAQRTLDIQYYIYDPGKIGQFLTQRILAAADRGVRVRLLLDDNNQGDDRPLIVLASHPNIEVRVFNPFKYRGQWMKIPQYLWDLNRVNRRMHNKVLIADNLLAVLGGRNIGDNYFDVSEEDNFRDYDLLMAGPLSRETSRAFDDFWNSPWAVPVEAMDSRPAAPNELDNQRRDLQARVFGEPGSWERYRGLNEEYSREVIERPELLVWAGGEVVWDSPNKVGRSSPEAMRVAHRFEKEFADCRRELLVESAYFIPGPETLRQIETLIKQGVAIKVVTSALEATDQTLVFSAYRRYRETLLKAGVELYEYKVQARLAPRLKRWFAPRAAPASLHAKALVFDRQRVWIGSFNLDPRSVWYNTEIAVVIRSSELAEQMAGHIYDDASAERSWKVELEPAPPGEPASSRRGVRWLGEVDGIEVERTREPARSWWQRLRAELYALIPGVEKLL